MQPGVRRVRRDGAGRPDRQVRPRHAVGRRRRVRCRLVHGLGCSRRRDRRAGRRHRRTAAPGRRRSALGRDPEGSAARSRRRGHRHPRHVRGRHRATGRRGAAQRHAQGSRQAGATAHPRPRTGHREPSPGGRRPRPGAGRGAPAAGVRRGAARHGERDVEDARRQRGDGAGAHRCRAAGVQRSHGDRSRRRRRPAGNRPLPGWLRLPEANRWCGDVSACRVAHSDRRAARRPGDGDHRRTAQRPRPRRVGARRGAAGGRSPNRVRRAGERDQGLLHDRARRATASDRRPGGSGNLQRQARRPGQRAGRRRGTPTAVPRAARRRQPDAVDRLTHRRQRVARRRGGLGVAPAAAAPAHADERRPGRDAHAAVGAAPARARRGRPARAARASRRGDGVPEEGGGDRRTRADRARTGATGGALSHRPGSAHQHHPPLGGVGRLDQARTAHRRCDVRHRRAAHRRQRARLRRRQRPAGPSRLVDHARARRGRRRRPRAARRARPRHRTDRVAAT